MRSVWQQVQEPPPDSEGDSESSSFQVQSLADLKAAARILEQHADTDDQAQKEMLWVARDYLPRVVRAGPGRDPEAENVCRQMLAKIADRATAAGAANNDRLLNSLLLFDGLLLVAGAIWFLKMRG